MHLILLQQLENSVYRVIISIKDKTDFYEKDLKNHTLELNP